MTDLQTSSLSLYEEMSSRGVDLSWLERAKRSKRLAAGPVPLETSRCSRLSVYLLKQDGSLWTVRMDGEAYSQVREPGKPRPRDAYVCLCCKHQWRGMPSEHQQDN